VEKKGPYIMMTLLSPRTDKQVSVLKWIGTILFFTAGILLSSNIEISRWGYILFFIGHIIFIYVFWKDRPMLTQNIMFTTIDLWGIYRWWLV